LARHPRLREQVGRLYRAHRSGYHPITRRQIERVLRELGVAVHEVNPLGLGGRRAP
jgi:hypothetical protein